MRINIYKPINRTRVMAAFFNGSTTEAVAIQKWIDGPLTAPYVPPAVNTRDINSFQMVLGDPFDGWVEPGDVVVRNIDDGHVFAIPREKFFELYTYADHIDE